MPHFPVDREEPFIKMLLLGSCWPPPWGKHMSLPILTALELAPDLKEKVDVRIDPKAPNSPPAPQETSVTHMAEVA